MVRSAQATGEAHKAGLEKETRLINEEAKAVAATTEDEISSASKVTTASRLPIAASTHLTNILACRATTESSLPLEISSRSPPGLLDGWPGCPRGLERAAQLFF